MHIKRIIIQGFKTYKNTTTIDLLSPEFNVVVGRNGSGKSNFFQAIRFVLSDAYTHITREERQGLIHEGSGTVMSAYVEIIFDNTDRRLPIGKDEISVRRTIGLKKDDYSLDGKSATRSDIMNLLESAGFSRSNPYYIVPQGKITSLTNSRDHERLSLLKDVSGAKIFELKLKESLKEMTNSNLKKQRIDEALHSINERLSDLQIESEDLKNYQSLDQNRKIYEFNLFDRELNDLNNDINNLEIKYEQDLENSQTELEDLEAREKLCSKLIQEINDLKNNLKILNVEKEQNEIYLNQLLENISNKENELNESNNENNNNKIKHQEMLDSIEHYRTLIHETKEKIIKYKPRLNELTEEESKIKNKLVDLSTRQRALYSKQNRFSKFNSKSERDEWLKVQIKKFSKDLKTKEIEDSRLKENINLKQEEIMELEIKQQDFEFKLHEYHNNKSGEINQLKKQINELKFKINEVTDARKQFWRDEIKCKSIKDSLTNDLNNANNLVSQTMDRSQSQGLSVIDDLVKKLNLQDNVYGPLINLFTVSDKYKTAAEVIAGNSLFHVIVDNDQTASLLMEQLIREKMGRITFVPINRLPTPPDIEYPNSTEHQCIPLIKKIKFSNAKVSKVIHQVFGKTIVVSELNKGSELSKAFNLTAITLDGDRVDTRGALTGGFRDYKSSRLDAIKLQNKKKSELHENEENLRSLAVKIENVNKEFTELNNELTNRLKQLDELNSINLPIESELSNIKSKLFNYQQDLKNFQVNYESILTVKQNLLTNLNAHESELKSDFTNNLNDQELVVLSNLKTEINNLENQLNKIVSESSEIENKLTKYESELIINYNPHLNKLLETERNFNTVEDFELEEINHELDRFRLQLDDLNDRIRKNQQDIDTINQVINKSNDELNKSNNYQLKLMKKIEKISKSLEKNLNKKSILISRRNELNKKISDIGVLPEDAFDHEKYEHFNNDELLSKLNQVNQDLQKYAHINKKAIEQFDIFTNQRNDLVERRKDLNESKNSIEALIENLKIQKDEAITKSFKNVATSFSQIFETLVPAGTGRLIMQRKKPVQEQPQQPSDSMEIDVEEEDIGYSEDVDIDHREHIEDYVGVSISVSFNSKHDEQQRIEQLSGGQKSLCAITLILAIQNCDPAPFYLFDEIDANLDTQYRTAVAAMIKNLSNKAQFICTTFRPEMLQVANKFYGVTFSNKVSNVAEITREDATSFVEGQSQPQTTDLPSL